MMTLTSWESRKPLLRDVKVVRKSTVKVLIAIIFEGLWFLGSGSGVRFHRPAMRGLST